MPQPQLYDSCDGFSLFSCSASHLLGSWLSRMDYFENNRRNICSHLQLAIANPWLDWPEEGTTIIILSVIFSKKSFVIAGVWTHNLLSCDQMLFHWATMADITFLSILLLIYMILSYSKSKRPLLVKKVTGLLFLDNNLLCRKIVDYLSK